MSLIPARIKKIQLKMNALECSQDFSHYKSMGIFPDAQGQLTPQSLVRSGPPDRCYSCHGYLQNEEDLIKMKALEWSQHKYSNFSDAQGQITLVLVSVSGRNLNSSKL